jgi:hypothetical protein
MSWTINQRPQTKLRGRELRLFLRGRGAAKTVYLISSTRLPAMALTILVRWVVSDAEKFQITLHISVSKLHIDIE